MTPHQEACVAFGRQLIDTSDLDPLYTVLDYARLDPVLLGRYLLAYGMFYHWGVAAGIAQAPDFWDMARQADEEKWPRGTERRHFRGAISRNSIAFCSAFGEPEETLARIYPGTGALTFHQVFDGAQTLSGFGPWIAFKMADIADRTGYRAVDFAGCNLSIYRDPVKGAALWRYDDQNAPIRPGEVGPVCEEIRLALGPERLAPPRFERPINIQEVETVLCKYKSHVNGHYPPGKDTREGFHALAGWGPLADRIAECPLF